MHDHGGARKALAAALALVAGFAGAEVLAAGAAGLFVNLAAARVLHGAGSGLNIRAAKLHVLADLARVHPGGGALEQDTDRLS